MTRSGIFYFVSFFVYVIAQAFFKNLVIFNTSFCFLYVAFILLMPIETNNLLLMFLAFAMGFAIDIFYDSLGMHAFTMVLIASIRNYWLGVITPQGGYDAGAVPNIPTQGIQWFLVYTLPLVFVHHLILFLIESGGLLFWFSMLKSINSLLFTMTVIVLLQYLIPNRSRT
ncbi:MAG: Rod shape-determining protein MreD [Cyclobacteriaceae bacterium]